MPERITEEGWHAEKGHTERYEWAAKQILPTDVVLDIACGIGYGAELLAPTGCLYVGVDKPGIVSETFADLGQFIETDIDTWFADVTFDVAICFETLEHVGDAARLVKLISQARRLLLVSVPTVPTVGINPWHLRDFTEDEVPELFPTWTLAEKWHQPQERSHVYSFTKD